MSSMVKNNIPTLYFQFFGYQFLELKITIKADNIHSLWLASALIKYGLYSLALTYYKY